MSNGVRDGGNDSEDRATGSGPGEDTSATETKRLLGPVLGCWTLLGLGMALTPLAVGVTGAGRVGVWSTSLGLVISAGPIVGALVGLLLARVGPMELLHAVGLSATANGLGYVLFVLVFVAILAVAAGSRLTASIGDVLVSTLAVAVPVAITAGGVTGIGVAFGWPWSREGH